MYCPSQEGNVTSHVTIVARERARREGCGASGAMSVQMQVNLATNTKEITIRDTAMLSKSALTTKHY